MLNPPLFIRLTDYKTEEVKDILISRIHEIEEVTNTEELRRYTSVRTWLEMGAFHPQGIQMAFNSLEDLEGDDWSLCE